jgi:CelD/BcsL family acetyltransferase involved in cellulose biosynthesis
MLEISLLGNASELEGLREEWKSLLQVSAADTVFLTWEWASAWWKSYGSDLALCIVRIRDGDSVVALAPLYLKKFRRYGFSYTGAYFVGDGSDDSDYLDVIVRRGDEERVAQELATFCLDGKLPGDLLFLNEVPETSGVLTHLQHRLQGWHWQQTEIPCMYVDLPDDWETYLKGLAPRMRTKVRSLTRELERNHVVRYEDSPSEEQLAARLEDLFRLHRLRWQTKNLDGVFVSEDKRRFYYEMSSSFLAKDWLRFYSLAVDDRYVAHQFCFEYKKTLFLLQEGFDPEWEELGIGNVLRAHVFRDCIERGVKTYDFLGGATPHKQSWGGTIKKSFRVAVGKPLPKNALFFSVPRILDAGKDSLKAVLPARVLAWRRSLLS